MSLAWHMLVSRHARLAARGMSWLTGLPISELIGVPDVCADRGSLPPIGPVGCLRRCCHHLSLKSSKEARVDNGLTCLQGIFWQEEIIPFFQQVTLNKNKTCVQDLYLELADKVGPPASLRSSVLAAAPSRHNSRRQAWHPKSNDYRGQAVSTVELKPGSPAPPPALLAAALFLKASWLCHAACIWLQVQEGLGGVDPYFSKLADGMRAWIAAWDQLNPRDDNNNESPLANGTTAHTKK